MEHEPWWEIKVPVKLITDRNLTLRSRFIYMLLASLCPKDAISCLASNTMLFSLSGIRSRGGLQHHLEELVSHKYLLMERPAGPHRTRYTLLPPGGPTVTLPAYLIQHAAVPPEAKALYALMAVEAEPEPEQPMPMRQDQLAALAGIGSANTVRGYVRALTEGGWLKVERRPGIRSFNYIVADPHRAMRQWVRVNVGYRIKRQEFKGEAIMKEMLNVLVPDPDFEDNARPGFIINPGTQERLEVDRYYPSARVAFEFNGPQHYRPTEKFSDPAAVQAQRARDLIKTALLMTREIHLITVHPEDLSLNRLREMIGNLMPVRPIRWEDPVTQKVEQEAHRYRKTLRLLEEEPPEELDGYQWVAPVGAAQPDRLGESPAAGEG